MILHSYLEPLREQVILNIVSHIQYAVVYLHCDAAFCYCARGD